MHRTVSRICLSLVNFRHLYVIFKNPFSRFQVTQKPSYIFSLLTYWFRLLVKSVFSCDVFFTHVNLQRARDFPLESSVQNYNLKKKINHSTAHQIIWSCTFLFRYKDSSTQLRCIINNPVTTAYKLNTKFSFCMRKKKCISFQHNIGR